MDYPSSRASLASLKAVSVIRKVRRLSFSCIRASFSFAFELFPSHFLIELRGLILRSSQTRFISRYTLTVAASINEADYIRCDITKTCYDEANTGSPREKSLGLRLQSKGDLNDQINYSNLSLQCW